MLRGNGASGARQGSACDEDRLLTNVIEDPETGASYGGEAVLRAAKALDCFTREAPRRTLLDLTRETGVPRDTLRGILNTLVARGMLRVDADETYQLGFAWLQLAFLRRQQMQARDVALPIMRGLVDKLGETVILSTRVGDQRVHIEYVESPQPVRRLAQIGNGGPLHVGAAGMALLASLPRTERDDYLARVAADASAVRDALSHVQREGFAMAVGSVNPETAAVARGFHTKAGECFAVTVSCPTERFTKSLETSCIGAVKTAVQRLELILGAGQ
ncbi:MAG: iclR helix-turn-helix domain protein [Hyphomicrobiales bacterium]|nr:iclR helix-turn-helix domain protein [Hyphomicrobiales bacterium]